MTTNTGSVQEIKVGRLLAQPGKQGCLYGATIRVQDGRIVSVEASGDPATAGEGRRLIAFPALADAHDHGRGLHHVAIGAKDEMFEIWRAALYAHPPVDPYLNTALAFARLARAGVSSVVHVHSSINVDRLPLDAEKVAQAARDVGIRVSFVVPLRDQLTLGYGDDEDLLALHPEQDRETIRKTWLYPFPSPEGYMELVRSIGKSIDSDMVSVQYGPNSPQACSDALLARMAEESARDGRRITTHLLETKTQREWADAAYPQGFMNHLDALGLLSERFTGAHGVWLTPEECDLMAARSAMVAVNTSSNLRLRSGVAPVGQFIKSGMPFAFGIDSFSVDDDDDALRELRLTHWLHSPSYATHPLDQARLFNASMTNGFYAVNNKKGYGSIVPGAPADLVLLDYDAMAHDVIDGMADETDLLLTRAKNQYVDTVIVAGREVVRGGKVLGVDVEAIEREVLAQARASQKQMELIRPVLKRSQSTLSDFYRDGGHINART
jgi:cytosine/adenosine deaminase-related metal-dependent hydrolase